ncbi:MAG: hypothetical protein ACRD0L_14075, partial [Acidimicrobiales bacterium]
APDRPAPDRPAPDRPAPDRPGRRRALPLVVVGVVVAALVVAGILVSRLTGGGAGPPRPQASPTTTGLPPAAARPVPIAGGVSFDPRADGGDGSEDPSAIPNLFDHNPATVWQTQIYYTREFGNLKPGVGFILHLAAPHRLHALELLATASTLGWKASVYVSDQSHPAIGGWGTPVAAATATGTTVVFPLGGHRASYVLVWFTELGPARTAAIGEATLTGQ